MKEKLCRWVACCLPRDVAYWAAMRVGVHATVGPYKGQVVSDLRFMDALERWVVYDRRA